METKAKREYQKTTSEILNKGEEKELQQSLEILRLFLETTDFKKLRKEYEPHLIEGKQVKFTLHLVRGKPRYEIKIL